MVVHPEVGKWLIGLGEQPLRHRPVRLAGRQRGRRHADGAGDGPAGPPAHRLDAAGLHRRAAALLRRPALRAVAAGAARHLPGVLPALRGLLPGRRPGLGPAPDGAAGADRLPHDGLGLGAGARAALAARGGWRPGCASGLAVRHQVERAGPARGVRAAGVGLGRRRPPVARRAPRRGCARRWSTRVPAFFYLVGGRASSSTSLTWTGWLLHADAYEQALSDTQYGPYWGDYLEHGRHTASSPSCSSRCARCGTTTRTSARSTPGASTTPPTPTSPSRSGGWC